MTASQMDDSLTGIRETNRYSGSAIAWAAAVRALTGLSNWWQRQRDIARLSRFNDVMLHDVGITRGGIESAVRHGRR